MKGECVASNHDSMFVHNVRVSVCVSGVNDKIEYAQQNRQISEQNGQALNARGENLTAANANTHQNARIDKLIHPKTPSNRGTHTHTQHQSPTSLSSSTKHVHTKTMPFDDRTNSPRHIPQETLNTHTSESRSALAKWTRISLTGASTRQTIYIENQITLTLVPIATDTQANRDRNHTNSHQTAYCTMSIPMLYPAAGRYTNIHRPSIRILFYTTFWSSIQHTNGKND